MNVTYSEEQLDRARDILHAGPLCDECLGRAFARVGRGLTNSDRGQALRAALPGLGKTGVCWVCGDLFAQAERWAECAARQASELEFATYLFGVRLPARIEEMEVFFGQRFPGKEGESLKHAFNRVVGKAFEARLQRPATVAFVGPDLSFVVDPAADHLALHVASVFVYGRYRKLTRGIPQTKWPCRRCRGRGCVCCGFTGKQYPESVEEWIGTPLVEAAKAETVHLHGAGREDIDARMLGHGRPFVLEIVTPQGRTLELKALRETINTNAAGRVEVSELAFASRETVVHLKEERSAKRYRAWVEFDRPVTAQQLDQALGDLCGKIEQRTPIRVSHRRADKVRIRQLLDASGHVVGPRKATIELEGEGGLYIKELVSGDEGRTNPSLSGLLRMGAVVRALDVLEVRLDMPMERTDAVDKARTLP